MPRKSSQPPEPAHGPAPTDPPLVHRSPDAPSPLGHVPAYRVVDELGKILKESADTRWSSYERLSRVLDNLRSLRADVSSSIDEGVIWVQPKNVIAELERLLALQSTGSGIRDADRLETGIRALRDGLAGSAPSRASAFPRGSFAATAPTYPVEPPPGSIITDNGQGHPMMRSYDDDPVRDSTWWKAGWPGPKSWAEVVRYQLEKNLAEKTIDSFVPVLMKPVFDQGQVLDDESAKHAAFVTHIFHNPGSCGIAERLGPDPAARRPPVDEELESAKGYVTDALSMVSNLKPADHDAYVTGQIRRALRLARTHLENATGEDQ